MIGWATRRPAAIGALALSLMLAGGFAFVRLPLATKTTVELPKLQISVAWPGASAELVETYITAPIEAVVQEVRGVHQISSESAENSASLTIELEPHANVQLTRLGILERLEVLRPDLPSGSSPPSVSNYVPEELEEAPLLVYTVSGPYTAGALGRLVRETIDPQVSAIPGVAGVRAYGGAEIGVAVTYDAQRARQIGVTPAALSQALRNSRIVQSLGTEQEGMSVRRVVLDDEPGSLAALGQLPVVGAGGRVYRISDLADIRPEEDANGQFYRIDGLPAVSLSIARLPGADAIKTAARVRERLTALAPTLPPGVRLSVQSDQSVELARQLKDLVLRGAIAFAAVMLVLAFTLSNARAVILVMLSAAVAIAGTSLGLYLLHIPANLLTLAGLGMGIGILVQNGLVVVDRLRSAPDTPEGRADAGRRITPAVLGATLTTAVVLFPFLYLQGNARAAFMPFAAAFALALGWSVVSSLIVVPALGAGHGLSTNGWPRMRRVYRAAVNGLVRWRWATLFLAAAIVGVVTWGFVRRVPRSSFGNWYGDQTTVSAHLSFPRGSDPASLDRGMRDFESIVVGRPGVERVTVQGNPDGAYMTVYFTKDAGMGPLPYEVKEALTQRALLIGGASVSVFGRGPGFYNGGGGGAMSFRIKILGFSYEGVEQVALDLKRRLLRIPRVSTVDINAGSFFQSEKAYAVVLQPNRAALARFGLTSADFAQAVTREVRGPVGAQRLEIGGEELPVTLKSAGTLDRNLRELRSTLVSNPNDAPVRVGDLASVDEREAVSNISRENQQYVRILSYDFRGPSKLAQRTHDGFMKSISVAPGYSVGDDYFEWTNDHSNRGLWVVFGVGVALVLLAVAMVFDSIWAAAIVFLSLPLALAGVGGAFWALGATFGREAAVGVILVVGLAVNQTILLVDAALEKRRAGRLDRPGIVVAADDRSGMIMLVTLTTLASLIPLAVGTDADSLFGSIALATTGGTIAGTIGAMLVVPAMLGGGKGEARREKRETGSGKWGWIRRVGMFPGRVVGWAIDRGRRVFARR
ncbi:MAG TPA: efflux RND transporter permease subunit [Gemmatimonadales bacterium]|nr:efflux RND transporter permease subunit [Gemmatimonadales bacterium]